MKKLLKLITMLFLASAMVISCGGGSGSDAPSTSDCTETVSKLELSDGEWTVYVNETSDYAAMEMELEATVTNGAYDFTSGNASASLDLEKGFEEMGMPEEALEEFKNLSDKEKNAMFSDQIGIPEGYDISWDGLTLNVEGPLSAEDLADMEDYYDPKYMPEDAEIKTNADKTKYTIKYSSEDKDAGTLNVEIIVVKK